MFKGKKGIIFDIDGTLLDSIWAWNEIDRTLILKIGGFPEGNIVQERDEVMRMAALTPGADVYITYDEFLRVKYRSAMPLREIVLLRNAIAEDYLVNKIQYKDNADVFIKLAKSKGLKLSIASLTQRETLKFYKSNINISSKCDFESFFDLILLKEDVIYKKPNPEIYLKSLSLLKLPPQECIVIEDSLTGVKAARAAGVEVISMYDKHSDSDRLEINQLSDFCAFGYDELIEDLQENL